MGDDETYNILVFFSIVGNLGDGDRSANIFVILGCA
jgi:hypothetical protein